MRIILLLAAAAMSGPAAAQPSTAVHHGKRFTPPGAGSPGWRARADFRRGTAGGWGARRDRRAGGHHRRFRDEDLFLQAFGFAEPFGLADPHGNGFFGGGGGEIRVMHGRPYSDDDRSYPYEWASAAAGPTRRWVVEEGWDDSAYERTSYPVCSVERGVRVCRGGR
jgi:hypothetical protein